MLMCPGRNSDITVFFPLCKLSISGKATPAKTEEPKLEAARLHHSDCGDGPGLQGQIGNNHVELIKTTGWSKARKPSQKAKINLFNTWLNSQLLKYIWKEIHQTPPFLWKKPLSSSEYPGGGRSVLCYSSWDTAPVPSPKLMEVYLGITINVNVNIDLPGY